MAQAWRVKLWSVPHFLTTRVPQNKIEMKEFDRHCWENEYKVSLWKITYTILVFTVCFNGASAYIPYPVGITLAYTAFTYAMGIRTHIVISISRTTVFDTLTIFIFVSEKNNLILFNKPFTFFMIKLFTVQKSSWNSCEGLKHQHSQFVFEHSY